MKRQAKILTLVALLAILIIPIATYASSALDQQVSVFIDGKPVQFNKDLGYPIVENGRTLVPVRIISEDMGYEVKWDNPTQKVTISDANTKIEFKIGDSTALINGKRVPIDTREDANGKVVQVDTKARLINSRTYVPIRFITENFGGTVDWKIQGKTLYVYIVRPGTTPTTPNVGTIPGTADYSENGYIENIKKVGEFFGKDLDKNIGGKDMVQFNPIGGGTDTGFLYVVDRPGEDFDALVVVQDWYKPTSHTGIPTEEAYKKINPTVKEVLRFYLPNGYEELYKIIDDGFNWRWDDASKYLNKDISNLIGSDKKVEIIDAYGLQIKIGTGK
ncbi:copper amine oxidase N-terminal domain-containing protein [Tissierella praeacuta]|uniref:copper amine oxidase N-terminal domain-containing protein n=1 Tax=Tissierella praeacuta TaxID=43131 RepID=UPI001C107C9A|nr:copper amine oxidase N-terminal domain-containing protein [Tissierella praeacuta]MBU5257483.1 copper amine oxidase N-terminal domain-containing protein [Tissierella praeacuta]